MFNSDMENYSFILIKKSPDINENIIKYVR